MMPFPDYLDILKPDSPVNLVRLVRDRALETWRVEGGEHQVRPVLGRYEHEILLKKKLLEEAFEVIHAPRADIAEEICDVIAVLKGIAEFNHVDWAGVLAVEQMKEMASGPFREGMVWDRTIQK